VRKVARASVLVLAVISATLVGLLTGILLGFRQSSRLSLTPWQRLDDPPDRITELALIDWADLYVQTEGEKILKCCWVESELPRSPSGPASHFPCESTLLKPTPPGRALDRLDVTYCGPDYAPSYSYVLLEDGTVWRWSYSGGGLAAFGAILTYGLCGLGLGLGSGLLVVAGSRWRRTAVPG